MSLFALVCDLHAIDSVVLYNTISFWVWRICAIFRIRMFRVVNWVVDIERMERAETMQTVSYHRRAYRIHEHWKQSSTSVRKWRRRMSLFYECPPMHPILVYNTQYKYEPFTINSYTTYEKRTKMHLQKLSALKTSQQYCAWTFLSAIISVDFF